MLRLEPQPRARKAASSVVIAAVLLLTFVAAVVTRVPVSAGLNASVNAWVLPRLGESGSVSLNSFHGRPVVAALFASWCIACERELPQMAEASRQVHGRVAFVGIDSEDFADPLPIARRAGILDWPLARDIGGSLGTGLHDAAHAQGMPVTLVYDSTGTLRQAHDGALDSASLKSLLRQTLGVTT